MDWSDVLHESDCNKAAELFTLKFVNICDLHAPIRTIQMKDNAPAWITNDFLAHRDERKYYCKNFKKNPSPENKVLKEDAIKRCNDLKLSLQRSYFQEALARNAGNMKNLWKEIKNSGLT